ncbi:hypothetical protein HQ487_01315 [Candidatus Uhrbacteria bacterium]|nr:hypothetical protein [Candidatus Uhrbacteria bacterium]
MKLNKTLFVGALVAVLGAGAIGIGTTLAAQEGQAQEGMISGLVSAIAEKFNLSSDEVQAVFDEYHEVRQEEMQVKKDEIRAQHEAKFEERLAQAVEDGELTQAQVDAIIEKMAEMRGYMEEFKDLTPETRKDAMQTHVEELRAWAEEQNIPMQFLRVGPPPQNGQHSGQGEMKPHGNNRPGFNTQEEAL